MSFGVMKMNDELNDDMVFTLLNEAYYKCSEKDLNVPNKSKLDIHYNKDKSACFIDFNNDLFYICCDFEKSIFGLLIDSEAICGMNNMVYYRLLDYLSKKEVQ